MCNREIHIRFIKMNQSYCLYCDRYLKQPQYKITNCYDNCIYCNVTGYIIHENGKYCINCARLIKYYNSDLLPMERYKKQSVYHQKYYILNTINEINTKYNIFMNDYQKYIILGYYNKIHQWEQDNNVKKLSIKYIIKQIYIDILHYKQCNGIKIHNNIRKLNDYLIMWNRIKENINFYIHGNTL